MLAACLQTAVFGERNREGSREVGQPRVRVFERGNARQRSSAAACLFVKSSKTGVGDTDSQRLLPPPRFPYSNTRRRKRSGAHGLVPQKQVN